MTPETLLAFAIFALVGSITPGPNNVMLTATGATVGIKRGIPTLLGITLGFSLMVALVALGLGSFITAHPAVMDVLRIGGIGMLLWLSWKIASAPVATDAAPGAPGLKPMGFLAAAAFQWINPKAWLVAVSAVSTYFASTHSAMSQSLVFGGVFLAASIPACFVCLSFGAAVGRLLHTHPTWARAFNYAMAALLVASIALMIKA